jgi:3-dehydroquinate synthetase
VVNDLTGFAAGTYLRGIRWVGLPTSLLAMCDASLGGKTGIDLPQGKNLAGVFHSPSFVINDPIVLESLPFTELRNGMAEVIKHGIIADPQLFELCRHGWNGVYQNVDTIVRRAIAVKVKIVNADPFEKDERAVLNLGHTFGHAIEKVSQYRVSHGEAVAIGIILATRLAVRLDLAEKNMQEHLIKAFSLLNLPTYPPEGIDPVEILDGMAVDKKRTSGKLHFVLPSSIGDVRWGIELPDERKTILSLLSERN